MKAVAIQALVTVLLGGVAFLWVARRGQRSEVQRPLLTVLGGLVLWMGGKGMFESTHADEVARLGMLISYAGACSLGPGWLLLAARYTHSGLFQRHPGLLVAAWVPPAMAYLALLTNDGHRLWSRGLGAEVLQTSAAHWGGPIFWMALAWQIMLVVTGSVLFLHHAATSLEGARRRRAAVVALAALIPVGATLARYLDLMPSETNPIPLVTAAAVATIIAVAVRYRLLDSLPLARRDVIDSLSDAVILADAHGLILDLNPAAHELLGEERVVQERPVARMLARLTDEAECDAIERNLEEAFAAPEPPPLTLRTRHGRELEVQIGSVRNPDGEATARYAVVRDLTESRRYERLLRESQQRVVVGGLAAGLAHEVNNPLAFVASNLQQVHRAVRFEPHELESLEKNRAEELSELAEVVGETIEGVERIAEIVGRIIRPGTLSEDDLVRLDFGRVVHDAVRLVEFHGESSVRTQVQPMADLPPVDGCPERLSQALLNLMLNAQQAAGGVPDGSLFIDAASDGEGISLRLGIQDREGQPFCGSRPAHGSDAHAEAELSAAYETVREHGGALESGAEPGVLFVLRLPSAA